MHKKLKLVLIEWIDAHAGEGWQSIDQIKDSSEYLYSRSVGWLVSEKNGCKVIVPHLSGENNKQIIIQGRGDITIPNKTILRMTTLKTR